MDVGGGSIQISLFDKDSLVTTQNIRIGNLRMGASGLHWNISTTMWERLIEENDFRPSDFPKLFLKTG